MFNVFSCDSSLLILPTKTSSLLWAVIGIGYIVAFNKPLLGTILRPGLSVGILFGAAVIVVAWLVTWYYVRWANTHYDSALERLRS